MTVSTPETTQIAVNDIGSSDDFLAAIDATIKNFDDGDLVEGTIVKVDRDEVLLDIGYKTEGVIPARELSIRHDADPDEVVNVGDTIEALVLQKEDKEGRLILSKKRAQYERAWGSIEKVKEEDGVVTGTVIEVVKGGLIVDVGLRGFLPASLVEMRRVRDLTPYIGQQIEAKIIELDKNRNNVVLSRRAFLEQTQSEVRSSFLTALAPGQVRKGVVSSIVNFGAFVDLGGVDGLVHVSELSWKHIDHPNEVVSVGQEVEVEVLDIDMDRERVSLSLKATQEDPWAVYARTHAIGQIVPGKVTKLVPFGAQLVNLQRFFVYFFHFLCIGFRFCIFDIIEEFFVLRFCHFNPLAPVGHQLANQLRRIVHNWNDPAVIQSRRTNDTHGTNDLSISVHIWGNHQRGTRK